ncbi:MAG: polymer-forming cytoskeletal protein [Saprospiraceae bacterium]|nr:polymer-forming cytoskeletal protein [Saprospiraceae bacterium]
MFNSKQNEKPRDGFSINSLSEGSSVTGNLIAVSDLRIDGTVNGNIECSERVIIGETGKVEGDIKSKSAIIQGKLNGSLMVSDSLEVHSKASIHGDITTSRLIVENGAIFNVQCNMIAGSVHPTDKKSK